MMNRRSHHPIAGHYVASKSLPLAISPNECEDLQPGWGIGRLSLPPMKRSKVYSSSWWWPAALLPYLQVSKSSHLTFRLSWWPHLQRYLILGVLLLLPSIKVVDYLNEAKVSSLALPGFHYPLTRLQHPSQWAWYPSCASSSNKECIPHWVADLLVWPPLIQGNPVCACILYIEYTECSLAYLAGRWASILALDVIDWDCSQSKGATSASPLLGNTNPHSGCLGDHRESPSYAWPSSYSTSCSHLGTCSKWWILFESAVNLALLVEQPSVLAAVDDHWQGHLADLPCLTIFNIISIIKPIKYIQPIKLPNCLLNYQSTSWVTILPLNLPKCLLPKYLESCQSASFSRNCRIFYIKAAPPNDWANPTVSTTWHRLYPPFHQRILRWLGGWSHGFIIVRLIIGNNHLLLYNYK